jgi:hypothetical protein
MQNAQCKTQTAKRRRSSRHFAFLNLHLAFCILPLARGLSTLAQRRCCTTRAGQQLARLFQQSSILALPTGHDRSRPPGLKPQHQSGKAVRRKACHFRRRDYRNTRPTDQGGLAGIAIAANASGTATYSNAAIPSRLTRSQRQPRRRLLLVNRHPHRQPSERCRGRRLQAAGHVNCHPENACLTLSKTGRRTAADRSRRAARRSKGTEDDGWRPAGGQSRGTAPCAARRSCPLSPSACRPRSSTCTA